jgi:hypothetical protein
MFVSLSLSLSLSFSLSLSTSLLLLWTVSTYFNSPKRDWKITSTAKVLWLGALAKEGHWRPFHQDTPLLQNSSLLHVISDEISRHLRDYFSLSKRQECTHQCHTYSTTPFSFHQEIFQTPPQPISEVSPSSSSELLELSSYHTGIEFSSCSPSLIIAGFAQSAVSIIYSLLLLHPQVLPPLGSSQIQEDQSLYKPSCYRTDLNIR